MLSGACGSNSIHMQWIDMGLLCGQLKGITVWADVSSSFASKMVQAKAINHLAQAQGSETSCYSATKDNS